jgi:hypothetical protein
MENQYLGSCLCGAVTFKVQGSFERFFLCHCSRCRKDTGSAHAANLFSTTARLEWLSCQDKASGNPTYTQFLLGLRVGNAAYEWRLFGGAGRHSGF